MTLHKLLRLVQMMMPALASLGSVWWIFFKILRIAKEKNIVDLPGARKLQKEPVPVLGGIAVLFGVLCGLLVGCCLIGTDGTTVFMTHQDVWRVMGSLLPIVLGMGIMAYTGMLDDVIGVKPSHRILIEVLTILGIIYGSGACADDLHEVWGIFHFSWYIAVPLTVFAGVTIINAINMADGVNGLSSGLCLVYSATFGMAFAKSNDFVNAVLAFSMAGALLPFFVHNVFGKKSRMFIGDAGTMVMGILMTWFVITMLRTDTFIGWKHLKQNICLVAMCLAIMSVPLADLARVVVMRAVRGKSPFTADRTHLHHALLAVGFSHSITALIEILLDMAVIGIFVLGYENKMSITHQLYLVCIAGAVLIWGTYVFLDYHTSRKTRTYEKIRSLAAYTHLENRNWWIRLQTWLDKSAS